MLKEIDYNKLYVSKCSNTNYKIVEEVEPRLEKNGKYRRMVKVKFIDTGYETIVTLDKATNAKNIRDKLIPSVCGVGIIGYAKWSENKKMYVLWNDMIDRCYSKNDSSYDSYGAKGITVCERWKRFDYFLEDIKNLHGYDEMINNPDKKYNLDKDALQIGIPTHDKIYSPETCIFIEANKNKIQMIKDNFNNESGYYGVRIFNGIYKVYLGDEYLGSFSNVIAAANAYNEWRYIILGENSLHNDVPYMSREEWVKYMIRELKMVRRIDNYIGVSNPYTNYNVKIEKDGISNYLGSFTNKEAAANCYNWYAECYGNKNRNDVKYMPPIEWTQYKTNTVKMCHIIDNTKPRN